LATGCDDKTAVIWDANNFDSLYTFRGHTELVSVTEWNSDEPKTRIATGSNDQFIEVWSPDDIPLHEPVVQEDISDNYWEIVNPELSGIDVHLGKVVVSNERDSLYQRYLYNDGDVPVRVDSIMFIDDDSLHFHILSGLSTGLILPGDSAGIEFRFKPLTIGKKVSRMSIFFYSDTLIRYIRG